MSRSNQGSAKSIPNTPTITRLVVSSERRWPTRVSPELFVCRCFAASSGAGAFFLSPRASRRDEDSSSLTTTTSTTSPRAFVVPNASTVWTIATLASGTSSSSACSLSVARGFLSTISDCLVFSRTFCGFEASVEISRPTFAVAAARACHRRHSLSTRASRTTRTMRPARVPARDARAALRNAPSTVSPSSSAKKSGAARTSPPPETISTKSHNSGLRSPLFSMKSGTSRSRDAVATRSSQK